MEIEKKGGPSTGSPRRSMGLSSRLHLELGQKYRSHRRSYCLHCPPKGSMRPTTHCHRRPSRTLVLLYRPLFLPSRYHLFSHISGIQAQWGPSTNAQHHETASNSPQAAPCQRTKKFGQTPVNEQIRPSQAVGEKRRYGTEEQLQSAAQPRENKKQRSDGFVQKPVRRWEAWTSSSP